MLGTYSALSAPFRSSILQLRKLTEKPGQSRTLNLTNLSWPLSRRSWAPKVSALLKPRIFMMQHSSEALGKPVRGRLVAGIQCNQQAGYWGKSLTAAVFAKREKVVRLLLHAGANTVSVAGPLQGLVLAASRYESPSPLVEIL